MNFNADINDLHAKTDYWGWVQGLYLAKNDDGIAVRLLHGYEYEPQSRKLWRKLCSEAKLVIDVGAHTGIYSLDAWEAGAKFVISIEPYHMNYARLVMNLRHANRSIASTMYCAAGENDEFEILAVSSKSYYCSAGCSVGGTDPNAVEYPVLVRKLDSMLGGESRPSVRAIKIDTERNGIKVLRGATQILEHRPDLILECIEEGMGEILKPLGYKFYKINEDREENFGLEPVADLKPDEEFTFHSPNRFASVRGMPDG